MQTSAFFPHLAIMHRHYAFLNWSDDAAGQYYQQMVVIICSVEAGIHFKKPVTVNITDMFVFFL